MLKRLLHSWVPHPLLSLTLLIIWLLLNNSIGPGNLLLGSLLALSLSRVTANFWPERPRLRKPLKLLAYLVQLFVDILIANLQVALLILGPRTRLHPAFVELPLELTDPFAITVLASVISLTPGTVSADVIQPAKRDGRSTRGDSTGNGLGADADSRFGPASDARVGTHAGTILLVHSIDAEDAAALCRHLKQRYEAPLLEIFR
ncbi:MULTISPECIES: Na+/H+ antiporter subunit E [Thiorhodovibrio]|uniref:Na+/H+ antiporter subunit E n=1 Tax=Thiorhodovibrio TaxID=61593 RepID=UPI001914D51D|nr:MULTISPECIES: Na+/H+ antiporter subunit E [Thiorhodovibrio]MBK5969863.1 Na+/H+ antiporter subunit E [Thiorhodovibrio winogradskyi]WPL12093.1 Multiple resistance and pH homeostasis protein E [Thiorhodovibrio litoralis]